MWVGPLASSGLEAYFVKVLVEVLQNWQLAHVTLMDRLTRNLDWFLFE